MTIEPPRRIVEPSDDDALVRLLARLIREAEAERIAEAATRTMRNDRRKAA